MSEIRLIEFQVGEDWLLQTTDETELLTELGKCVALSVDRIKMAAAIVKRFEDLGHESTKLERACSPVILRSLRRIAYGQMLPETFMKLDGRALDKVGSLPLADQKMIVEGGPVKVMLPDGDHLMVTIDNLHRHQVTQVFARGHIRDEAEQISYLAEHGKFHAKPEQVPTEAMIDRRRRVLVVSGAAEFTERQLIAFIAELAK